MRVRANITRLTCSFPRCSAGISTRRTFATFAPGQPSPLSRNTVSHGVATPEQFDEKGALLGLLTLDQLYFFLPTSASGEAIPSQN